MNRPNKQLFLDNLESLRALARKYNRKDELAEIEMKSIAPKNLIKPCPIMKHRAGKTTHPAGTSGRIVRHYRPIAGSTKIAGKLHPPAPEL
ncbi:MAG: hypothetical protein IPM36_04370 [Lewinellaceae bacterium]|nr:hypothetical protein [Lewinellaceae bacterium]